MDKLTSCLDFLLVRTLVIENIGLKTLLWLIKPL